MSTEDNFVDVIVVVSGQPHPVRLNGNQKVAQLIREALRTSGNVGQQPSEWELRTNGGALIDPDLKIVASGITDGMTLFLNPRAGVGG